MSDVLSQPKGAGTTVKNGTISVGAPLAAGTGAYNSNYTIDTWASALPATGTVVDKYTNRFDDYNYYSS